MTESIVKRNTQARTAAQAARLEDIPNIGPSIAADLRGVGIATPDDVRRMDPRAVYDGLRTPEGQRHDPCVLDVFLAAHDFMRGGAAQPWWNFTARRKRLLGVGGARL
ncbi:MAG: helix-hairpin-helix domain-containing protein [Burkholderiaceae bacterium]|jgi:DNA transformation protein|nr:helix-hairpin-helix domain-containing protein [Burkholderiaceae bacterium]